MILAVLAPILASGVFFPRFQTLDVKCEEMGFENPSNAF
jgi:hypothetical protein